MKWWHWLLIGIAFFLVIGSVLYVTSPWKPYFSEGEVIAMVKGHIDPQRYPYGIIDIEIYDVTYVGDKYRWEGVGRIHYYVKGEATRAERVLGLEASSRIVREQSFRWYYYVRTGVVEFVR